MSSFLTDEQQSLAEEIAALLTERGETVSVAEATTGGMLSAGLLSIAGASKYYVGGGVVYTLKSRVELAGVSPEEYRNYRGTTPEIVASLASSMRERLETTWCLAESGVAGPPGGRSGTASGRTNVAVAGPVSRSAVYETGLEDRATNMSEFTTLSLRFFAEALREAGPATA